MLDYIIDGVRLGTEVDCALNAALPALERIARNAGHRDANELFAMDRDAAFSRMWTELYSADATDPDAWDHYGRLLALPGIDCFDPWKAFLIERTTEARFLWKHVHSVASPVCETRFPAGEFDDVVAQAIEWIRSCIASPP